MKTPIVIGIDDAGLDKNEERLVHTYMEALENYCFSPNAVMVNKQIGKTLDKDKLETMENTVQKCMEILSDGFNPNEALSMATMLYMNFFSDIYEMHIDAMKKLNEKADSLKNRVYKKHEQELKDLKKKDSE